MISKVNLFEIESIQDDKKYTKKVGIPQYLPKGTQPNINSIYSRKKYDELMQEINISNLPDDEKEFLRLAATRHIVFDYSKIADYYAHASKEMQDLMEKSALVIIDLNDAIANGYAKLDKRLSEYARNSYKVVHGNEGDNDD